MVISSLIRGGGAERVMSLMANRWASEGRAVTLITLYRDEREYYPIHPQIELIVLGDPDGARGGRLARLNLLRRTILDARPDVVISFMDRVNVLTLLAVRGIRGSLGLGRAVSDVPVFVCERTDPRQHHPGRMWEALRRLVYPSADKVVVQTESVRDWATSVVQAAKVSVIPNPVLEPAAASQPGKSNSKYIVGMGRLVPVKRFELLVRAFADCAEANPDWTLVILGDGPERASLHELARRLGVDERVSFPGELVDPLPILAGAELFVLSSAFEGFPNSLLEAMACGVASIATNCPSGPAEIIRDGIDGILIPVDDYSALAAAVGLAMSDPGLRQRLAASAVEVRSRFSLDIVMSKWDDLIRTTSE